MFMDKRVFGESPLFFERRMDIMSAPPICPLAAAPSASGGGRASMARLLLALTQLCSGAAVPTAEAPAAVRAFLGLRYALPPVGERRLAPAELAPFNASTLDPAGTFMRAIGTIAGAVPEEVGKPPRPLVNPNGTDSPG